MIDTTPPVTIESLPHIGQRDAETSSSGVRSLGFVTIGVGAAGVAIGAVMGVLAIDRANAANIAGCDVSTCPTPQALGMSADAKTFAIGSDIGFIAGATLAVVGIILVVAAPRSPVARVALRGFGGVW